MKVVCLTFIIKISFRYSFDAMRFWFFISVFPRQHECEKEMEKHQEEVRLFEETYDRIVDEDGVC